MNAQGAFFSSLINVMVVFGGALMLLAASLEAPLSQQYPIENTMRPAAKRPLILIGADGKPFARRGDCVAAPVTIEQLPGHFVDAVLAMEDRRFYSHLGVDPLGILRAAKRNFEAGGTREGGSTITQQLVKISYLTNARTLDRKIEEALLALWLEIRLSKDEILERYVNSAYFGEGCFGVRAAAKHFFNKPVRDLSVAESAFLVALLPSPTQLTRNLDDAQERARLVMQSMVRDGRLDAAQLAGIGAAQLDPARAEDVGGYYADWLAETLQKEMNEPTSRQPILVQSSFQPELQQSAQEAVRTVLEKRGAKQNASQAAMVVMRTDGRVLAMVGGKDRTSSQFNRAVQAKRQPGSAFKTFVYLAALQAGLHQHMTVVDEPISIDGWEPKNYDNGYRGSITLTQAFASSVNSVAIKLSEGVGRERVIEVAHDLGITSPLAPNASLALGTSEVSLLELTAAYAAIPARAYPVKPWGVLALDKQPLNGGEPPAGAGVWKLPEAEEMQDLMAAVVDYGSGTGAGLPIQAFGKTGTSQEYRDAWFVGFAGNLVVGVWVGNDDFSPMKRVTGGSLPAQIWRAFMVKAMRSDPGFERKLPKIAAFKARSQQPPERVETADITSGLILAEDRGATSYGHIQSGGRYVREPEPVYVERYQPRTNGGITREFQKQLNDMGWPGN